MDSGRKLDPGGVERGDITDVEKKGYWIKAWDILNCLEAGISLSTSFPY